MLRQPARTTEGAFRGYRNQVLVGLTVLIVVSLILLIPTPLNAGALAGPVIALLLLSKPILLPLGLVASVPVQDALPLPEDVPITATRVMTGLIVVLLPLVLIRTRATPRYWMLPLLTVAILVVMIISLWNATDLSPGYAELYRWLVALFALLIVLMFIRTREQVLSAFAIVATLAIAQGGFGLFQSLTGAGPASFQISSGFSRAFGTFGMPNSFAAYMEMVTIPLIPLAIWTGTRFLASLRCYRIKRLQGYIPSRGERREVLTTLLLLVLVTAGATIGLASIAASFSRGGWLGTITALGIMILLMGRRTIFVSSLAVVVLALALIIGAGGAVISTIGERFGQIAEQVQIGDIRGVPVTDDNFATVERMSHWQTAIAMWDRYPWIGVGAGNYNERFTEFAVHPQFMESQGHAHNYYLHMLSETGLAGLLVYAAFLVGTIVIGLRAYRSSDDLVRVVGIGAIGISVALIVHNFFENLHVLNISMQMMLVWGLAIVAVSWEVPDPAEAN
jgi:O-antigen ligase